MAKVKLLTGLSGPDFSLAPGEVHVCGAAEAKRLIDRGMAEEIEAAPKPVKAKAEKAVKVQPGAEKRSAVSRVKSALGLDKKDQANG
ncbi:MAG: hypothetical protein ACK4PC_03430 [Sphingopyxis sp.]